MTKVLIAYASITGNDAEIADILEETFENNNLDVNIKEISQIETKELLNYDIDVIVTYTYDDQFVPEETIDFYKDIKTIDLSNKIYGCCGSGDTFYDDFCASVDRFDKALKMSGGIKGAENVYVELAPEMDDIKKLDNFAYELIKKFNTNKIK